MCVIFGHKNISRKFILPAKEVGKRTIDAFNQPGRQYLDQPKSKENNQTIGDVVLNTKTTPLDYVITQDFLNSLTEQEQTILEDLSAGYTVKEILIRQHISNPQFKSFRKVLEEKAIAYLM